MHPNSRYISLNLCAPLAQRGFTTFCTNSEFSGRDLEYYGYEQHAPGLGSSINYLKNIPATSALPAVKKVLLFGFSMGAPLMLFYQNVAENGPSVCQGPEKIIPCDDTDLHNLPKPDGVMLRDAHLGDALATFTYMDPSIIVNANPPGNVSSNRNPNLDLFSPANGYNLANDSATYTSAFAKRYTAAQAIRNLDLISQALDLLQQRRIQTGNPNDMGDAIPFTIVGGSAARLWQPDLNFLKCTQRAHPLLARDGTRPTQVICSVRVPSGQGTEGLSNASTLNLNVHTFLGAHALRTNGRYTQTINDITGVDYDSSATSTVTNVKGIKAPLVIIAHTAHYFNRPDEILYDAAITLDKTIVFNEGAVHGGTPCAPCALQIDPTLTPAQASAYFGDTLSREADFYAEWLAARF
jgi:hypothetical protein